MSGPLLPLYFALAGYLLFAAAGLKALGLPVPMSALTALGVLALGAAKFLQAPREGEAAAPPPEIPGGARRIVERFLPTVLRLFGSAEAELAAHRRLEAEVGGGSPSAFRAWVLSGLRAAACWIPICLLAMLAGAVVVSPLKLVSGGLDLAQTETGQWLLRQSWPRLVGRVAALEVLGQVYLIAGLLAFKAAFRRLGFKEGDPFLAAAAVAGACYLSFLLTRGFALMQAAPLLGIQLALFYAYARTRSLLVPAAANVFMGLASLYSARMVVLLKADLGSLDALPGIPGARGVLIVLGVFLVLLAVTGAWRSLRERPTLAAAPLWGVGIYLSSYLTYYAAYLLWPVEEVVPALLKQTLLMPLDMLVYVFLIGAALEELIFRKGLFKAIFKRAGSRFWPAAALSAGIFSGFHFIDFSAVLRFLGVNASRLIESLLMVYGFSLAGFAGRVTAGLVLALLYHRAGVLLVPILAHFTSNLLEAVGLRWGLPWMLAAVGGIFALELFARRRTWVSFFLDRSYWRLNR